ncbi:MAG: hypothetical protein FD174_993 [Geobacteraceae bacterium]|nr:MAG: hypothetical protein FD174_993 [Geobacteraceae bacterium]
MIKCIVFDFDGTLVKSNEIKRELFFKVIQPYGDYDFIVESVLREKAEADRYVILTEIASRLIATGNLVENVSSDELAFSLISNYAKSSEEMIVSCEEVSGTTELLNSLLIKGISLFINSATPLNPLKKILMLRLFDKYFAGVYGRPNSKIENMQIIMDVTKSEPSEIIFIGDNEVDRQTAETIGCYFIGINNASSCFAFEPNYSAINMTEAKSIIFNMLI